MGDNRRYRPSGLGVGGAGGNGLVGILSTGAWLWGLVMRLKINMVSVASSLGASKVCPLYQPVAA